MLLNPMVAKTAALNPQSSQLNRIMSCYGASLSVGGIWNLGGLHKGAHQQPQAGVGFPAMINKAGKDHEDQKGGTNACEASEPCEAREACEAWEACDTREHARRVKM